jgi:hypothetical protein
LEIKTNLLPLPAIVAWSSNPYTVAILSCLSSFYNKNVYTFIIFMCYVTHLFLFGSLTSPTPNSCVVAAAAIAAVTVIVVVEVVVAVVVV